jgi:PAS domain-containing protein
MQQRRAELEASEAENKYDEEELRENEELFRRLVETANVIPWEADPTTWRFTYIGPQAAKILGYPMEEWYGDDF